MGKQCPLSLLLVTIILKEKARAVRQGKDMKRGKENQNRKGQNKLFPYT